MLIKVHYITIVFVKSIIKTTKFTAGHKKTIGQRIRVIRFVGLFHHHLTKLDTLKFNMKIRKNYSNSCIIIKGKET